MFGADILNVYTVFPEWYRFVYCDDIFTSQNVTIAKSSTQLIIFYL